MKNNNNTNVGNSKEFIKNVGHFDQVISNPPFGKIKHPEDVSKWLKYQGAEFDVKVCEVVNFDWKGLW